MVCASPFGVWVVGMWEIGWEIGWAIALLQLFAERFELFAKLALSGASTAPLIIAAFAARRLPPL